MKVREAMSSPAATCHPGTSLAEAGIQMLRHDCGVLPVVDEHRGVVGIITDRDICVAVSTRPQSAHELRVEAAMTAGLRAVDPDDTLLHALDVMRAGRVHRLPVVDADGTVAGVISIDDIVLLSGAAVARKTGPSPEEVLSALREIRAHWRPHVFDAQSIHPIVPAERHTSAPLAPVMAPERAPASAGHHEPELEELEPLEHTSDYDWEE